MESCPNCGASIRAGSRFCTSCGFRLPDVATRPEAAAAAPAPNEVAGPAAGEARSPWAPVVEGQVEETPTEPVSAADAVEPVPDAGGGTVPQAGDPSDDEMTTPELSQPAWPGWDDVAPVDEAAAASDDTSDGAEDATLDTIWPAVGGTPVRTAPEAYPEDIVVSVGTSGEWPIVETDEPGAPRERSPSTGATAEPREVPPVTPGAGHRASEPELDDWAESDRPGAPLRSIHGELTDQSGQSTSDLGGDVDNPVDHAMVLLDELRGLIGEIQSEGGSATAVQSPAGLIETLLGARAVGREGGDFSGLAAVLAAVRDQPRDIDAMLQLLGRLDDLIALQAAYGRCQEAIEATLNHLLPDGPGHGT
jgi:hypothetical protein